MQKNKSLLFAEFLQKVVLLNEGQFTGLDNLTEF